MSEIEKPNFAEHSDTPVNKKLKKLFFGSYTHNIDSKGRVIIPVAFREALGENFVYLCNP